MTEDIKNEITLRNKFYHEYIKYQTDTENLFTMVKEFLSYLHLFINKKFVTDFQRKTMLADSKQ